MALAAGWTVRRANASDADAIESINIDIAREVYRNHVPDQCLDSLSPNVEACKTKIAHPRRCVFVGLSPAGKVAGFAEGGVDAAGDGVLLNLWIRPEGRGPTRLAVALVRELVACLVVKGTAEMRLEVASHLGAARELYGRKMRGEVAEDIRVGLSADQACTMDGHIYYWPNIQELRARLDQLAA